MKENDLPFLIAASRRILAKLGFRVERYGEQYGKRVAYYTYAQR